MDRVSLLGGVLTADGQILCPGPNHGPKDRSLSVKFIANDEFICNSFCGDDPLVCRRHIEHLLGLPAKYDSPGAIFAFRDPSTGKIRYHKKRWLGPGGGKTFSITPAGRGGAGPLLYGGEHLADIRPPDAVWIVEGEKKVDKLRSLGVAAVSCDSGANSAWAPEFGELLKNLPIIIWPDSDWPGEKYARNAIRCIRLSSPDADIKIVRPFGPPSNGKGKDVCDWHGDSNDLAKLAKEPAAKETRQSASSAFEAINPIFWHGVIPEGRKWIVPEYIPAAALTILSGDGGRGKSLLALQLAVARACALEWIGCLPSPGRTLYISAEDDRTEIHRRLYKITTHYNRRFLDLGNIRIIELLGIGDHYLAINIKNMLSPSEMYNNIIKYISIFCPDLIILDVLSEFFPGNENDRTHARAFIQLLRHLCMAHQSAVLLLAHPSRSGLGSGTGFSGSTDWFNGARSWLYLTTSPDEKDTSRTRILKHLKANHGKLSPDLFIEWAEGVFIKQQDKMPPSEIDSRFFFWILKQPKPLPDNCAVKIFHSTAQGNVFDKEQLWKSLRRMLASGQLDFIFDGSRAPKLVPGRSYPAPDRSLAAD